MSFLKTGLELLCKLISFLVFQNKYKRYKTEKCTILNMSLWDMSYREISNDQMKENAENLVITHPAVYIWILVLECQFNGFKVKYMHAHRSECMHICAQMLTCVQEWIHIYAHMYTHANTHAHTHTHKLMHAACTHMHTYICTDIYTHMHAHMNGQSTHAHTQDVVPDSLSHGSEARPLWTCRRKPSVGLGRAEELVNCLERNPETTHSYSPETH